MLGSGMATAETCWLAVYVRCVVGVIAKVDNSTACHMMEELSRRKMGKSGGYRNDE